MISMLYVFFTPQMQVTWARWQSSLPIFHYHPTCSMWQSNSTHHFPCPERLLWQMEPNLMG